MSLAEANNHLAVNLHRLLAEDKGNVFFSPFSISTAMAMLLSAAEGETSAEMRTALGHDHAGLKEYDVATVFKKQISGLSKNPDSYTLSCANSMLSQKGFEVKDAYKHLLVDAFKAFLMEVDFQGENEKTVAQINEWVKEKTNGMIPKLVESLDSDTVLVLLNAVYFKGIWVEPFDKRKTYLQKFYNNGSEANGKEVEMMHLTKSFPFYEDETLQVLQLSYIGEEVTMLLLLPRAKDGLESVEASLTPTFVEDFKQKLRKQKINVTVPRFRMEYTKSLIPCFQSLGVARVFSSEAELGIASDSPDLLVSDILHKAVLEVNEEGSEAAAATMVGVRKCGPGVVYPQFVADRPFAFVIYDTRNNLVLFMGRVNEL